MKTYLSNTYRKDLNWLHFDDEPMVQERQQVKDQRSCISIFVPYPTILSSNQEHQHRHENSIPYVVVCQIYRYTEQSQEKESLQNESRLQYCGDSFSNRDNARANLEEKVNPSILKDDFRQERTHLFLHQQNQCYQTGQSFSSIEINKSLPASVHSVSQIKFKFRSQFQLLPKIRCLMTFRL